MCADCGKCVGYKSPNLHAMNSSPNYAQRSHSDHYTKHLSLTGNGMEPDLKVSPCGLVPYKYDTPHNIQFYGSL